MAQQLAKDWNGVYVPRQGSIAAMQQRLQTNTLFVQGNKLVGYHRDQKIFFHPSMAAVRIKRLILGENDLMLEVARIQPGDIVVDATLGLGSDSIVFAYGVGSTGQVYGCEASPVLSRLVAHGLQTSRSDLLPLEKAMRKIEVKQVGHLDYLRSVPDKSVDVVYFDPMFGEPVTPSSSMNPIREWAIMDSIHLESVEQAVRVARKTVVLKERSDSNEFGRLGFSLVQQRSSSFSYGVIRVGRGS